MDKNSAMYGMTAYDIIYDTILMDAELANYRHSRNYELFDGDDGYVSFLTEKVEEYEKACEEYYFSEENFGTFSTYDAMSDFVGKNIDKWVHKLKGDHLYRLKVVLEIDAVANKDISVDDLIKKLDSSIYVDSDGETFEVQSRHIINAIGKEVAE